MAKSSHDSLRDLRSRSPEFEAIAIVSVEGVMLDSCLGDAADADHLSAMSAALIGFGDRITRELGRGALDHAILGGSSGLVLLMALDEAQVLIALLHEHANLGLALLDLRRAKADLAALPLASGEMETVQ